MEATVRPDNTMIYEEGDRPFTPNSDSAARLRQDTPEEPQCEDSAGKANIRRAGVGLKLQLTDTRPGTATSSEHGGNTTPRAFLDRRPGTTDSALASMPRFATTTMKFAATMRPMTATLGATAGGFYKTLKQATATVSIHIMYTNKYLYIHIQLGLYIHLIMRTIVQSVFATIPER